jgi:hypothetical protein
MASECRDQSATRRRLQGRVAVAAEIEQSGPEAARTTARVEMHSRIRAGRRQSAINTTDGGLYDWPVGLIDGAFIERVTKDTPDDVVIIAAPPPLSISAALPIPKQWPFWADNDERRARWTAMVAAQRMARNVIPQRSLDTCSRCRGSIAARRLDLYGPPERYAAGEAEWQKTARACDAARRMLGYLDLHPDMDEGLYEKMARDAQRLLMLVAERTGGCCSPSCLVKT